MWCKTWGLVVCWFVLGCGSTSSNDGGHGGASMGTTGGGVNAGGSANGSTNSTTGGGTASGGASVGTLSASSTDGTSSGGSGAGGTSAAGGNGGSSGSAGASGGSAGASGGSAGASGGTAGSAGDPADCTMPFMGPIGGPRSDGPESLLTLCDQISDEVILARYKDFDQKAPQGLYWEPPGLVSWWEEPCSESLEETLERSSERQLGEVDGQATSDWSHQVSGCYNDARRFYSNISCDYFDGTQLVNGTGQELAFLASLLWWMDHGNVAGSQILGYSVAVGGATDWVQMCTIRTTFGDFGLCDQITLEATEHQVLVTGEVTLGEPTNVRTIEGDCN